MWGIALGYRAAMEAEPTLLGPVMALEVVCDEDSLGLVIGDLGRRRGIVLDLEPRGADRVLHAEVPLAEAFGCAGALSGLTRGRGRFTLEPARYNAAA